MKNTLFLVLLGLIINQVSGQSFKEKTESLITTKMEAYYESIDSKSIELFKSLFSEQATIWGSSSEEVWDVEVFVGLVNVAFSNPEVHIELRPLDRNIMILNEELVMVVESTIFSRISQTIPTRMIFLFKKTNGDWLVDKLFYNLAPDNEVMLKIHEMDFR